MKKLEQYIEDILAITEQLEKDTSKKPLSVSGGAGFWWEVQKAIQKDTGGEELNEEYKNNWFKEFYEKYGNRLVHTSEIL